MTNRVSDISSQPRRAALLGMASAAGAALLGASLSACVTREVVVREPAPRPVVRAMPAPVREDRGPAPAAGYSYVPGHWKWEGNDWAWIHGKWVAQAVPPMPAIIVEQITIAPSPAHYWVPGHWVWRYDGPGGWFWVKGAWRG